MPDYSIKTLSKQLARQFATEIIASLDQIPMVDEWLYTQEKIYKVHRLLWKIPFS